MRAWPSLIYLSDNAIVLNDTPPRPMITETPLFRTKRLSKAGKYTRGKSYIILILKLAAVVRYVTMAWMQMHLHLRLSGKVIKFFAEEDCIRLRLLEMHSL